MNAVLNKSKAKKAIILGSGVSVFADKEAQATVPYVDIPGFPFHKIKGHAGVIDLYEDIWVLRGRAHVYQGFTWQQACFPTQFLIDNGIEELILTNAAGGLNPKFEIGDLMQIKSYINMITPGKERGNIDVLLQKPVEFSTEDIPGDIHRGTYIGVHGPSYETDAEVEVFRSLGADAVGMSTIPEIETAVNAGIKVQAVSVITNVYGKTEDLGHEGVVVAAKAASKKLTELLGIS